MHTRPPRSLAVVALFLAACSQTAPVPQAPTPSNSLGDAVGQPLTQADVAPRLSAQAAGWALVFVDYYVGINYVTPALDALGYATTVATSQGDFDTQLVAGGFDLAVNLAQGESYEGNLAALEAYIARGGRIVAADWSVNQGLAAALDASFTGGTNETSADLDAPLNAGVADPMTLDNPG